MQVGDFGCFVFLVFSLLTHEYVASVSMSNVDVHLYITV